MEQFTQNRKRIVYKDHLSPNREKIVGIEQTGSSSHRTENRTVSTEQRQGAVYTKQRRIRQGEESDMEQFTWNRFRTVRREQKQICWHITEREEQRQNSWHTEQLAQNTEQLGQNTDRTVGTEQLAQKRDRPLDTEHLVQN